MLLEICDWFYSLGVVLWNIILYVLDDIKFKRRNRKSENVKLENIENEVVIVTGANRGLGKGIALEFARRNAIVILGCRDVENGQKALEEIKKQTGNKNLEVIHLDLGDMNSVEKFAITVSQRHPKIKILVNNAGFAVCKTNNPDKEVRNGFNTMMAANHFGHFLLTNLLLEKLLKSKDPRVIAVSSSQQLASRLDPEDLTLQKSGFGFFKALPYSNSKHANSLFVAELAKIMKETDLKAYSMCPGVVFTDLFEQLNLFSNILLYIGKQFIGNDPPEAAVLYILHMALSKSSNYQSGLMHRFQMPFEKVNKKLEKETKLREILWQKSSELVGLSERVKRMKSILHSN